MTIASFLTAIHVIVALFMILVVLVQGGNSGGVGAAFGGGNSSGFFGASGGTTFFAKLTYGAAVVFMGTSIYLTVHNSHSGDTGLTERLQEKAASAPVESNKTEEPAEQSAPSTTNTDKK